MIRRLIRRMFKLALVIGAAAALYKVVQARRPSPALPDGDAWPSPPAPRPVPTQPTAAEPAVPKPPAPAVGAWVEPVDGACPSTHPVKAKLASKIYHLPGMLAYDRTNPDRCYRDEAAAEADGLRKAKR